MRGVVRTRRRSGRRRLSELKWINALGPREAIVELRRLCGRRRVMLRLSLSAQREVLVLAPARIAAIGGAGTAPATIATSTLAYDHLTRFAAQLRERRSVSSNSVFRTVPPSAGRRRGSSSVRPMSLRFIDGLMRREYRKETLMSPTEFTEPDPRRWRALAVLGLIKFILVVDTTYKS